MSSCRQQVMKGYLGFPCDLTADHPGPHRALEVPSSVHQRQVWDAEQKIDSLSDFQKEAPRPVDRQPHPHDRFVCPACDISFQRIRALEATHFCPGCGASFRLNESGVETLIITIPDGPGPESRSDEGRGREVVEVTDMDADTMTVRRPDPAQELEDRKVDLTKKALAQFDAGTVSRKELFDLLGEIEAL